jgi:beta-lactamase superfamily II metal-dependent hydrolase
VIGGATGESIVLGLPNGTWGVVDCYARSPDDPATNPTLAFLRSRGVESLEFVCLTHPHDDHFRGMSHLLEAYPVRRFWRFGSLSRQHLENLLDYLKGDADERGNEQDRRAADDLQKTLQMVRQLLDRGDLRTFHLTDVKPLIRTRHVRRGPRVRVWGIAPSSDAVERYQVVVLDSLKWLHTPHAARPTEPPRLEHNNVSAALVVEYGDTRLVLGGDVEVAGWVDAVRGADDLEVRLDATFVKASHHGSLNGHCPGLWDRFSSRRKPAVVVTSYVRSGLPTLEGVNHIARHSDRLLVTSFPSLRFKGSEDFDFPDSWDLATRVLAQRMFKSFRPANALTGCCSLEFDSEGTCVSASSEGAAAALRIEAGAVV